MSLFLNVNGQLTVGTTMLSYKLGIGSFRVEIASIMFLSENKGFSHNFIKTDCVDASDESNPVEFIEYRLTLEGVLLVINQLKKDGYEIDESKFEEISNDYVSVLLKKGAN